MLVKPWYNEDMCKLDQLVPYHERIQLQSFNEAVLRDLEFLVLTNNGSSFKLEFFQHLYSYVYMFIELVYNMIINLDVFITCWL